MRALALALSLVLLALSLVLLAPALAACSGDADTATGAADTVAQEEDRAVAEWRAALAEELGTDSFDFASLQQDAAVNCQRADAPSWTVALALSGDVSTSALTRIGLEHTCPDVVPAFDEAVVTVQDATDPLGLVCGPGVELGSADAMTADLACANR